MTGKRKVFVVSHPDVLGESQKGAYLFVCARTAEEAYSYLSNYDCYAKENTPKSLYKAALKAEIFRCYAHNTFFVVPEYTELGVISSFESTDAYGKQIILKNGGLSIEQVMMEWERDYMRVCVDKLSPYGSVLELGFGLGYSATRIMEHEVESYTVIECDPSMRNKALLWAGQYDNAQVVFGRWQNKIDSVGKHDCIFFDTFEPAVMGRGACEQFVRILIAAGKEVCRFGFYASITNLEQHKELWESALTKVPKAKYTIDFEPCSVDVPDNCLYTTANNLYTAVVDVRGL